ncbi:thiamine-phosphate kinase [Mariprofundus ferrinatatus]|uniref:Thiamine-monophosphate kinase n=1 Tax=Mariprofundus ferrinatatus TaxID=1921087 RepID=A0A2K8LCP9_9PROT|nr:thiamine-phosphate kinase [Mariprofundus ferrinatatus]ATX82066.1 thiamine-phosphate kinase [Mariprofundus ferrinatatus]
MSDNEFELIESCFKGKGGHSSPFTRFAIGDDASIHHPRAGFDLVVSSDTSVEGVHWPVDFPRSRAADRAVCAALSDLAAMGADAVAVWVNVMAKDESSVRKMGKGVSSALKRYNVELVGGDTCRSPVNAIAVTVAGELPEGTAMRRDLARSDDNVWLSGKLGFHALGLQQWLHHQRDGEYVHHLEEITPLISAGIHLREMGVRCCIDVSDGLLQDAGHIAKASRIGIDIELLQLPNWIHMCRSVGRKAFYEAVLHGGEDYALLFTAPAEMEIPEALAVKIGCCREGSGVSVFRNGEPCEVEQRGFLHFG